VVLAAAKHKDERVLEETQCFRPCDFIFWATYIMGDHTSGFTVVCQLTFLLLLANTTAADQEHPLGLPCPVRRAIDKKCVKWR